ncbi:hypothetical protein SLS53_003042 [Cytospora paraplurivora]|uniref:BRCT domain-containing protein n=1 Tax=Cytospora paraplurivora TaxID=2898453 RepID=A0AAN9UF68_9PEZI
MAAPAEPPKRITRSRAVVKPSTATAGTASSVARKIATAATKTKTTRTVAGPASSSSTVATSATRTSTKRKTRPDDHEDDSETETPAKLQPTSSASAQRATRGPGRPRKIIDPKPSSAPTPAPAASRPRGRPPKKPATVPVKEEAAEEPTRTRAKGAKVDHDECVDGVALEPVKRPRGRPVGSTKSKGAPTSKPVKTVTFAEPDKENVLPLTGSKAKTPATKAADPGAAGMRAKPVRKPTSTNRAPKSTVTKSTATKATVTKKNTKEAMEGTEDNASMPLGPRKVTQMLLNREQDVESEDELAMDRTPVRPFHRNPLKPPVIMKPPVETTEEASPADEVTASVPPTEPTVILGSPVRRPPPSPFKDAMKSPAKRIEGLQLGFSAPEESSQSGASPTKTSLIQSPAKRCPVPIKPVDLGLSARQDHNNDSPFKQALFQSPARRLFPPTKSQKLPGPESEPESAAQSPAPTPVLLRSPSRAPLAEKREEAEARDAVSEPEKENAASDAESEPDMEDEGDGSEDAFNVTQPDGGIPAVPTPEADPAFNHNTSLHDHSIFENDHQDTVEDEQEQNASLANQSIAEEHHHTTVFEDEHEQMNAVEEDGDSMTVDEPEPEADNTVTGSISTTPPNSPPQQALDMFGLRPKDQSSFDESYSESEHELTRVMTPKSVSPVKHMKGSVMKPRTSGLGFTPLAQRLNSWQSRSPLKGEAKGMVPEAESSAGSVEAEAAPQDTPMTIFEDGMAAWPDAAVNDSSEKEGTLSDIPEIKDPICEDISLNEEDFELIAEANEMSVMSPEQVESMHDYDGNDDTISEASQEYGDENEAPAANTHGRTPVPPVTPQRRTTREFHTVSKIPLKAADESTPPPQPSLKKRRHSTSRLPPARPTHGLTRSATVISYSPSHKRHVEPAFEEAVEEEKEDSRSRAGSLPPVTPTKSENLSNAASLVQTPRREVDHALLRGAVVFVDVHTMEGDDASAIFVELLNQMGARCVKSWNWNPNEDDASSKIGITHVVYKDGGKRTMEKVRETGGVVQCVGVGWVLDCERENEWLDEAPYYIDTSLVPSGGARRRKSMEPKALANHNGTPVSEPTNRKVSPRESQTAGPSTPAAGNRRDSMLWMHSPEDQEGNDEGQEDGQEVNYDQHNWYSTAPLTPVPKTPAPETIRRFAMELTPEMDSPMTEDGDGEGLSPEQLVQRTCPPKTSHMYDDLGAGVLGRNKDEGVARRLMDARRKSLAFAPKVSSPLAKSWKEWN